MSDDDEKHGVSFSVVVEEIQTGHRLPREYLKTEDEILARKTYQELVSRGYQVRLIRDEWWMVAQTEGYGKEGSDGKR